MKDPLIPWYVAGPLIGLIVPTLLIVREKQFGLSSSYRAILSRFLGRVPYFNYSFKTDLYQIQLVFGVFIAGLVSHFILTNNFQCYSN